MNSPSKPTRRTLLGAAGATGLGVALTACIPSSSPDSSEPASAASSPDGDGQKVLPSDQLAELGKAEVTVRGPASGKDLGVLLYRPDASTVLAYSNICSHQGCAVGTETPEANFYCACHGSRYNYEDGSVLAGPALRGLTRYAASIKGKDIVVYPPLDG
ncbi:Rieske (2Fe-2S) protein [Glutamicibacter sp.]|jgi:Rieske Fe-S protein|uniref:Rieske (2Fe-2S) protein n=1 Tax=Glutamicibacter sp. TaxID=1931995 RepID=UPI002B482464|nr:Rieske (2Fe-2S) protein [Glutamicibacter sp.]HJX79604.1 Rieske (2Fe-2S) protein [Glutamicibacter sp.]